MKFIDNVKSGMNPDVMKFKMQDAKPDILFGFGVLGVLVGTVLACVKTAQAKKAIDEHKDEIAKIETETLVDENAPEELVKQAKRSRGHGYLKAYGHLFYELVKAFGIASVFWVGGMYCITDSHIALKEIGKGYLAKSVALQQLFNGYRGRVAEKIGKEEEEKIFLGAREENVLIVEKDSETGEEKLVETKGDVFYAQPGSIYARNFTESTSDAFDVRSFADRYLEDRISQINRDLEIGVARFYTAAEIFRMLGFNENELDDNLIGVGISGNARLVPDKSQRELQVTRLRGLERKWDVARECFIAVPCLRLDFNFYPLKGKV